VRRFFYGKIRKGGEERMIVENKYGVSSDILELVASHPNLTDATTLAIANAIGVEPWMLYLIYPSEVPFTNIPKTGAGEGLSPHGGGWEGVHRRIGGHRKQRPPVSGTGSTTS